MGVCKKAGRIAIHHRNVPNMLAKFTGACSAQNINISDMINKSKGEYSYTLMDVDSPATEEVVRVIREIPEVLKGARSKIIVNSCRINAETRRKMATVRPFRCIRPDARVADRVAALPYDVYNRKEACAEVRREPLSFLKIDRRNAV